VKQRRVFWGETHNNVYVGPEDRPQTPTLEELCRYAATFLDFYAPAYYTPPQTRHPLPTAMEWEDDEPLDRETNYRVRVEQRNGQRAWSSPIWVRATERQRITDALRGFPCKARDAWATGW
jgi:hypothetical protein